MSNTLNRVATVALFAGLLALQASPAFAQAFTGAGDAAQSWIIDMATPFFTIAVLVVAILTLSGRIHWAWLGCILLGTGIFFGYDQVSSMFRGWMGV